jgi:hypothetical protein
MAVRKPALRRTEVRYSPLHNFSMALVASAMVVAAIVFIMRRPESISSASFADPRFLLFVLLGIAMAYYTLVGVRRALDRTPQVTVDRDGIVLGFGRNRRFTWDQIQWVRLHRLSLRPQLQIGLVPDAFVTSDLRLSVWNLDDPLRPVRGVPAAFGMRDNGLDTRASALLDAVRTFRPSLVKS